MNLKNKKQTAEKVAKYGLLLGIKESYLFSRNLLGLKSHPFKTIREIVEERDYSQAALVFGLPFNLLLFGLIFIVGLRFLIRAPYRWGWLAKTLLFSLTLFSLSMFFYLSYWFYQVWQWRRQNGR